MAISSIFEALRTAPPFESSRFPGWVLHVGYRMQGELLLTAIRKSDGKRLEFSEPWHGDSYRNGFSEASARLLDKLGAEFLELVPMEKP